MASAEHGYEDERFVHSISEYFHCGICQNVLKEPVTCQRHEHYVCRACITRYLKTSSTCPTCKEELSLEAVIEAPKILRDCLDELNIRCDYSHRGCQEIVQLAQLQKHVQVCGFSPVLCPNKRCAAEVNRQDLMSHQQVFCEYRTCCDCTEIRPVVEEINVSTNAVNDQMKELKNLKDIKEGLIDVKQEVSKTREDTNQVLSRLEALEEQVRATREMQESMKEAQSSMSREKVYQPQNILVAGGRRTDFGEMKFVELFNLSGMTWSPLQQMKESRVGASVFVLDNEITIVGGNTNHGPTESLTKIPISSIMKNASWSEVSTCRLPDKLYGHSSVLCDKVLINIGGCNKKKTCLMNIYSFPPRGFHVRLECTMMPEPRCFHGAQVFDNKIHIFGGRSSVEHSNCLDSVISYDFKENKIKQLASLPYPVSEMATVCWGDNVLLIGGADQHGKPLDTVVIYNVKTENWHILPPMNEKRKACSAVVIQNMIIVMGGRNQYNNCLRSVECFTFNNYSWQDFPAMITARERAVAVAF